MDIRTSDARTFIRLAHLVASLDRSRFTDEQLEIVDSATEAIERVEEKIEYNNNRQRNYMSRKREELGPAYAQSDAKKAVRGSKRGRPKKTESAE